MSITLVYRRQDYWLNSPFFWINIKKHSICLDFQVTQLKDMMLSPEVPYRPWECAGTVIFIITITISV